MAGEATPPNAPSASSVTVDMLEPDLAKALGLPADPDPGPEHEQVQDVATEAGDSQETEIVIIGDDEAEAAQSSAAHPEGETEASPEFLGTEWKNAYRKNWTAAAIAALGGDEDAYRKLSRREQKDVDTLRTFVSRSVSAAIAAAGGTATDDVDLYPISDPADIRSYTLNDRLLALRAERPQDFDDALAQNPELDRFWDDMSVWKRELGLAKSASSTDIRRQLARLERQDNGGTAPFDPDDLYEQMRERTEWAQFSAPERERLHPDKFEGTDTERLLQMERLYGAILATKSANGRQHGARASVEKANASPERAKAAARTSVPVKGGSGTQRMVLTRSEVIKNYASRGNEEDKRAYAQLKKQEGW